MIGIILTGLNRILLGYGQCADNFDNKVAIVDRRIICQARVSRVQAEPNMIVSIRLRYSRGYDSCNRNTRPDKLQPRRAVNVITDPAWITACYRILARENSGIVIIPA